MLATTISLPRALTPFMPPGRDLGQATDAYELSQIAPSFDGRDFSALGWRTLERRGQRVTRCAVAARCSLSTNTWF